MTRGLTPDARGPDQNKCGPGQPPGPHCWADYPASHFRARGMGAASSIRDSQESSSNDALGRSPSRSGLREVIRKHRGDRRPVLPCVEDSRRRPQLRVTSAHRSALWRNLPAIHPRELPGPAGSAVMLLQGTQEHLACLCATVPVEGRHIKRKALPRCAEAVNVNTSLWKPTENLETSGRNARVATFL